MSESGGAGTGSAFAPLRWTREVWKPVAAAMAAGRLHHALIVSGLAGTGRHAFARAIAAALWCRSRDAEGIACGACADCRQVASEAHSGYHWLRVPEDKKDIPIDKVRGLIEALQLTTHDGRAKVAIVDPADALNNAGVNALLKTIEEPSPGSLLILLTERPRALLPTLRSRCQQLRLPTPTRAEALAWLRAQRPDEAATRLAIALELAGGAPLRALERLDDGLAERAGEWQRGLLGLAAGRGEPLALADAAGRALADFVPWLHGWLLALLRARAGTVAGGEPELEALARRLPATALDRYLAEVVQAQYRVTTTANKALLAESLVIGWVGLVARAARAAQNPGA